MSSNAYENDRRSVMGTDNPSKPEYYMLELMLRRWNADFPDIYVLALPAVRNDVITELYTLEGILTHVPMGAYIDFLVAGPEENARKVGERLRDTTGYPVGGVRYQEGRGLLQAEVEWATRRAGESDAKVYFGNMW